MNTHKPRWTSASFLLYTGGLTVLAVAVWSLSYLSNGYGDAGFVGWSALVLAVLAAIALAFKRADRWIAAGVFALAAVVAFAVFVASLEQWWGWLPKHRSGAFQGFNVPVLLVELLVLVAALVAIGVFRFPLLVAVAAATAWYFVTDLVSGGGDWSAVVTFLVGLVFLAVAAALDGGPRRPYGFWLHVAAGLTIGGSLLFFWHTSDANFALVAVASLVYVGLAAGLGRSSWAVLGAIGFFLAGGHFADEWGRASLSFLGDGEDQSPRTWATLLVFAFVGFLLVALGLLLARRKDAEPAV